MCLAGCAWSTYSLQGQNAVTPALTTTAVNFLRALPFGLGLCALQPETIHVTWTGVGLALASGGLASGLGYALWYQALRSLTASQAAIVQLLVPFLASLGGVLWLGETLSAPLLIAGTLVVAGVLLTLPHGRAPRAVRHAPAGAPRLR